MATQIQIRKYGISLGVLRKMTDAKQLLLDDGMAIDQRRTAGRVRNFFEHDFERYLGYAGLNPVDLSVIEDTHLSSPRMDASGVSSHGGINHQEDSTPRIYGSRESLSRCWQSYRQLQRQRKNTIQNNSKRALFKRLRRSKGYGASWL